MTTLAELKANEVRLRNSLKKERIRPFKKDIRWALRFVSARRRMMEAQLGIGE